MIEDTLYRLPRILVQNPRISQFEFASKMGVSLGKVNHCLKSLIKKGLLKAGNFKNSSKKIAHFDVLTPRGIEAKVKIPLRFLR